MDIFSVITLLGGLAFFLYGMNVMSSGLEKLAGSKLEVILKKMTSNKFKSLLLGMGITIAIQSSSALTVMLVGLVNSGIMQLSQTIGVLMGSNIGTTFGNRERQHLPAPAETGVLLPHHCAGGCSHDYDSEAQSDERHRTHHGRLFRADDWHDADERFR